jgi:hypothetical protein
MHHHHVLFVFLLRSLFSNESFKNSRFSCHQPLSLQSQSTRRFDLEFAKGAFLGTTLM